MTNLNKGAPRAMIGKVRADANVDPATVFANLNIAVQAMHSEIDGLKAKVDPLDISKIDAMNATIGELQASLNASNAAVAALRVGGGSEVGQFSAHDVAHLDAFRAAMRSGQPMARGSTFSGPDGGFVTPKQVDLSVSRILGQTLAMRRIADVMAITGSAYVMHKSTGGAGYNWSGEGDTRSETNTPVLKRIELVAHELTAEPSSTQVFLDDAAVDVEAWYANEVAQSFAEGEGAAYISGTGVGQPTGFLSYTPVANASYAWGSIGFVVSGHASAFPAPTASVSPGDALIDLQTSLKSGYRQNGVFLMNDATLAVVRKMKDAEGRFIWTPGIAVDAPSLLLGKPVETDDNMPDIAADAYAIAFADWKQAYKIVDRLGIAVLPNPYRTSGLVFFQTRKRVGGGVVNFEAIKLLKISA